MRVAGILDSAAATAESLSAHLSEIGFAARLEQCMELTPRRQRRLWELASAAPREGGELVVTGSSAVFDGRNSLGLFSRFQKWFARDGESVVGCNRHVLSPLIGPGYFVVRDGHGSELQLDYGTVPDRAPAGWPAVRNNDKLFARAVYANLTDRVAWITGDVLVGAAYRGGKALDSYFVLVRR